jgi:glycosyltransferase involved in cell wall biosynthesis
MDRSPLKSGNILCSIVIPVYNEDENLELLHQRLSAVMSNLPEVAYEIIFVDDGSSDNSLTIMKKLSAKDETVKYVSFSRNFGHEAATTAGLDRALGDVVVIMDADLQNPPELISQMIEKWRVGAQVVLAKRRHREGVSKFKRFTSFAFYRLLNKLSEITIPKDVGDFRLMDKSVVNAFRQFREYNRFVRGLIAWLGFNQATIEYDCPPRHAGVSKYGFWKLSLLFVDSISSFSIIPLRVATFLGFGVTIISALVVAAVVIHKIFLGLAIPGYALTTSGLFFLGGVQMLILGILGEYMGKIYRQVQQRPLYIVKEESGGV